MVEHLSLTALTYYSVKYWNSWILGLKTNLSILKESTNFNSSLNFTQAKIFYPVFKEGEVEFCLTFNNEALFYSKFLLDGKIA